MNRITNTNRYLFEDLVAQIMEHTGAGGIAVAVVDQKGETQYENYFGYRDVEKKLPLDKDTIFGLASVTKSFVALSIMQLAEKGIIDLDAPVSRYIPEFTNKNQEPVLVRHFLSHSAGFFPVPRTVVEKVAEKLSLTEEKDGDLAYCDELVNEGVRIVAEQLDRQTKEKGLIGRPGEYMSYCNDGFGLLSEIVHRMGGEKSFADYVKKNILIPLGMDRSGADYVRPRLDENSSVLYKKVNGVMKASRNYYDNAFVLGGAGSMKSTLADMKKYITMYLNLGRNAEGERLLSMEGIRQMCMPRITYRPGSYYCYGLSVKQLDDLTIVEHGGSLPGVSSNLSWSYGAGMGVMVLCNTSSVPVGVIADAAMRMARGRCPLDDRKLYEENPWTEETVKAAVGRYVSDEEPGENVEIREEEDGVSFYTDGHKARFVMVCENAGVVVGAFKENTVELFKDENGKVFAVGYGGRMFPRV